MQTWSLVAEKDLERGVVRPVHQTGDHRRHHPVKKMKSNITRQSLGCNPQGAKKKGSPKGSYVISSRF